MEVGRGPPSNGHRSPLAERYATGAKGPRTAPASAKTGFSRQGYPSQGESLRTCGLIPSSSTSLTSTSHETGVRFGRPYG